MVRRKFLLMAFLAVVIQSITGGPSALAALSDCSPIAALSGACQRPPTVGASTNGESANIWAERPAAGKGAPSRTAPDPGDDSSGFASPGDFTEPEDGSVMPPVIRDPISVWCVPKSPCDPAFSVSISDLVSFAPATPRVSMEPDGWGVVGLPVNFVARASGGVQSGMLLGFQASVRFTALSYAWSYGDGGSRTTIAAGSTWHSLGVPEFSTTDTSHVFATSGVFPVRLTVTYGAEYRYAGQGWRRVIGTVTASSGVLDVVAGEAKTVLVNRDCTANPRGPGC